MHWSVEWSSFCVSVVLILILEMQLQCSFRLFSLWCNVPSETMCLQMAYQAGGIIIGGVCPHLLLWPSQRQRHRVRALQTVHGLLMSHSSVSLRCLCRCVNVINSHRSTDVAADVWCKMTGCSMEAEWFWPCNGLATRDSSSPINLLPA